MTKTLIRRALSAFLGLLVVAATPAAIQDSATMSADTAQTSDFNLGTIKAATFSNTGYTLGKIYYSGTLTEINGTTNDFATESKCRITVPDGRSFDLQFVTGTTSYEGSLPFSGTFSLAEGLIPPYGSAWTFRFINTFDDAPAAGVADSRVDVTFSLSDESSGGGVVPPTTVGDFGSFGTQAAFTTLSTTVDATNKIRWFKFTVSSPVTGTRFLDIDTETTAGAVTDSELVVFRADGTRVVSDDDDGSGNLSQLSFGPEATSRAATGTSVAYDGRDGYLPTGTYYLAVGAFNLTHTNSAFAVASTATTVGSINVRMRADGVDAGLTPVQQATDLGSFDTNTVTNLQSYLGTNKYNRVKWFKITLLEATGARYLDIDTEKLVADTGMHTNTAIALVRADGSYATGSSTTSIDTVDGTDSLSQLTYGSTAGSRAAPGNGLAYNGRDGNIPAGVYYLGVCATTATYTGGTTTDTGNANNNFLLTTSNTSAVNTNIRVNVRANLLTGPSVNNPPTVNAGGPYSIDELQTLTFTATASDPDAGNTVSFFLANAPAGCTINSASGLVTWTPSEAQGPGTFTFEVFAVDNLGAMKNATVQVTVAEVNQNPVLASIGNRTVNELANLAITLSATDGDLPGQTLTYSMTGEPAGATLVGDSFNWTPDESQGPGDYSVTFTVDDGAGGTASEIVSIHVDEVNQNPTLGAIGSQTVNELSNLSFTLTATDDDLPGQGLTYSMTGEPTGATLVGDTFSWTPDESQGPNDYSVTFTVTDSMGGTDTETVSIHVDEVNQLPTANDGTLTTDEDTAGDVTVTVQDDDLPTQTLTYTIVQQPLHGGVTGSGPTFTYTPDANYNGPDSFTYKANDGYGDSNEATVTVTVTPVNDPPVANDGSASGDENTNIGGNATASDVDGDSLTYSKVSDPANGSVVVNNDGSFTYTPNANFSGSDSFTFKANDGQADSNVATITITVNATNGPPVADDGSASGDEDTAINGSAAGSDPDNDPLTFSKVSDPANGSVVMNNDGSFVYTPNANFNGSDSFTFKVNDGTVDSNTATISITVNPVNDPPVADDGSASGDEDTNINGNATATDVDGDLLTYSLDTGAANGSVVVNGDGSFLYTPAANFNGTDSFTVKASDGNADSNIATITITVNPVNDAPVVTVPGAQNVSQGSTLVITGVSVADVDAGAGAVKATMSATNGSFSLGTLSGLSFTTGDGTLDSSMVFTGTLADVNAAIASLTFKHTPGYSGAAQLDVTVDDQGNTGSGGPLTDTEQVAITIDPSGPVTVHPAGYIVIEGFEIGGDLDSLLADDDNRLMIFNDDVTLGGTIEFFKNVPYACPSELTFSVVASVGRYGLSQAPLLYNFATSAWDSFPGLVGQPDDTLHTTTLMGSAPNYVDPMTGEVRARVHWEPINDEDPAQDGWPLMVDEISWTVTP